MRFNQYIISPAIVSENFDNEAILVNMSRGHYYRLCDSSFDIWQGLESGLSPETLRSHLASTYKVDAAVIDQSLGHFLKQLELEGLILEGTPTGSSPLPTPLNRQSFTPPTLEIYTDLADLLTLDPIHDVSPVQGWPIKK